MEDETIQTGQQQEPNGDGQQTDWKAESRKWERQSKDNYRALSELKATNDANVEQIASLNASLEAARSELAAMAAERDAAKWRNDAARETGVPADLLRGSTADEFMEHARSLEPYFKRQAHAAPYVGSDGGSAATARFGTREAFAQALEQAFGK